MAVREWWANDPAERYWLEITDREDLGANLHAPKVGGGAGQESWSYSLVPHVQAGDIVLHYWKLPGDEPGLVAWSRATGDVIDAKIVWSARGSYGRARGPATRAEPAWRVPLEGMTELDETITLLDLRAMEPELLAVRERLEAVYGSPLYFPFAFSKNRPLRPAEGYLAKFPRALVDAIPALRASPLPATAREPAPATKPSLTRRSGAGYMRDPVIRKAVERHGVDWTMNHYRTLGYEVEDVGATRPYDVIAARPEETLHIEVKASTTGCVAVELTTGEVDHADAHQPTILVVVDQIEVQQAANGDVQTFGGQPRIWTDWLPEEERLIAIRHRYTLPSGGAID